jgi:biopolymer transport protein TolQ
MPNLFLFAYAIGDEIVSLLGQSGPVVWAVLLILMFFSVFSWAIIISRARMFRKAKAQSSKFLRAFRRAQRFQDIAAVSEQFKPSPLVAVFEAGYEEMRRQGSGRNTVAVQRAMQIASTEELTRMESRLPWLATSGSVTPFIGLFGTVWGIIGAFHGLGTEGAATIRAVAPGISEALIATAAGLFVAIPAVIAYNQFGNSVREFGTAMDNFSLEMMNAVERVSTPAPRAVMAEAPELR